jgi:hypothetical protein
MGPVLFQPFLGDFNVGLNKPFKPAEGTSAIQYIEVFPNPFNRIVSIRFSLRSPQEVNIRFIDTSGRMVGTVVPVGSCTAGEHQIKWDGRIGNGAVAPAGLYFMMLKAGEETSVQKIILER